MQTNAGWITGTVTNSQTGSPISGAAILVRDKATGQQTANSTDGSGHFNLSVEPGTFTVNVSANGFKASSTNATVNPGQATPLAIKLDPLPGTTTDLTTLYIGIAAVVVIAAVGVATVVLMRRRKKKEEEEGKIQLPPKT